MSEQRPAVHAIAWREVFPWMRLLGVFQLAIRPRVLLVAMAAALVCTVGWRVLWIPFSGSSDPAVAVAADGDSARPGSVASLYHQHYFDTVAAPSPPTTASPEELRRWLVDRERAATSANSWGASFVNARPVQQLIGFGALFSKDTSVSLTAYLLLCLLWAIAVWALAGSFITRIAAVAIARGEQISWNKARTFALKKWPAYVASPLFPLVGVLLITLVMALFGFLIWIPYIGIFMVGVTWPVWLIGGFLMAVLLLGLIAGWPLMWSTVSCEGTDSFDALGRCYGYLFGRPLQYLGYILVSFVLGWLGLQVVTLFSDMVIGSSQWAVSWASGNARMSDIIAMSNAKEPIEAYATSDLWGAHAMRVWNGCIRTIPTAFLFSFFWNASVMVYLLLRRDEDQTEVDEVYLEEEQETYGLPPLKTDAAGVPEPADMPRAPTENNTGGSGAGGKDTGGMEPKVNT